MAATPGEFEYAEEIARLLINDRRMVEEAAHLILDEVHRRVEDQGLNATDGYIMAETEARQEWPALTDAVLIMIELDQAGLLKR